MIKLKVGTHGEILIPKKIRESLGIKEKGNVLIEIKRRSVIVKVPRSEDIAQKWKSADKHDVSKWKIGSDLYEEVF